MPKNVKKNDVNFFDSANIIANDLNAQSSDEPRSKQNCKKRRKLSIQLAFAPAGLWFKTELESEDNVKS